MKNDNGLRSLIAIGKTIRALLSSEARSATTFIDAKTVVRVSRKLHRTTLKQGRKTYRQPGKFADAGLELVVNVGRPNAAAVRFIGACKKAGEPFPVKRVQLEFASKRVTRVK